MSDQVEVEKALPMQHCFNCGVELGRCRHLPGDIEVCGESECQHEMQEQCRAMEEDAQCRAMEEDAQWRAADDGYSLYGGPGA